MKTREQVGEETGEGGPGAVSEEMLVLLKEEVTRITSRDQRGMEAARLAGEETRYCVWDGQSDDSRKHSASLNDEPPMPFEGACDQRVPFADQVINEKVALVVLASLRAFVGVVPVEGTDAKKAAMVEVLRQWLIRQMGSSYMRELIKLGNFVFGGEPGAALLNLEWRADWALEMKQVSARELGEKYVELALASVGSDPPTPGLRRAPAQGEREDAPRAEATAGEPESAQGAQESAQGAGLQSPQTGTETGVSVEESVRAAGDEFVRAFEMGEFDATTLGDMVRAFFPGLTGKRAARVARELLRDGVAEFPEAVLVREGPVARAEQINRDVYLPQNTGEYQRARMFFRPMWLSRAEVLVRAREEEWSEEFVLGLIGDAAKGEKGLEGDGAFKDWRLDGTGELAQATAEDYAGLWEVVYGYFEAVNEDGYAGRYVVPFSMKLDMVACERRLVGYPRGQWPGQMFQREVLTDRVMDARGMARLAAPFQGMLKLNLDTMGDHAQLSIPPLLGTGMGDQGRLYIEPLGYVPVPRTGKLEFLKMPEYSRAADVMLKVLWRQANEYFGRAVDEVPEWVKQLQDEFTVAQWLGYLADWQRQLVALAVGSMSDEALARVTNVKGEVLGLTRDGISGEYDVQVVFEARYLDPDFIEKMAGIVGKTLVPLDRSQTIETAPLVQQFLYALMPAAAAASLRTVEAATESELKAEFQEYVKILGGVEPDRVTDGSQNYQARLGMYQGMQQQNPAVFESLPEDRQRILRARLEFLAAQAEQFGGNVQIGREGARRGLGEVRS